MIIYLQAERIRDVPVFIMYNEELTFEKWQMRTNNNSRLDFMYELVICQTEGTKPPKNAPKGYF